jgi:hypothetical protein
LENAPMPTHAWTLYGFKWAFAISTICIGMVTWKAFKTPLSSVQIATPITQKGSQMDLNLPQKTNQVIDYQKVTNFKRTLNPIIPISKPIAIPIDSQQPLIIKKQIILHDTIYQIQDDD